MFKNQEEEKTPLATFVFRTLSWLFVFHMAWGLRKDTLLVRWNMTLGSSSYWWQEQEKDCTWRKQFQPEKNIAGSDREKGNKTTRHSRYKLILSLKIRNWPDRMFSRHDVRSRPKDIWPLQKMDTSKSKIREGKLRLNKEKQSLKRLEVQFFGGDGHRKYDHFLWGFGGSKKCQGCW